MVDKEKSRPDSRIEILTIVQTPLGFFVLVVLIVEVMFGGMSLLSTDQNRVLLVFIMAFIVILLVLIVAFTSYFRPWVLNGAHPPETASEKLANLLSSTEGRELLRALFRDCVEEYATGLSSITDIKKKYGLRDGTVVELAKITAFIAASAHAGRPQRRRP